MQLLETYTHYGNEFWFSHGNQDVRIDQSNPICTCIYSAAARDLPRWIKIGYVKRILNETS